MADVRRRVGPALSRLITWHAEEAILVVAHQAVFRSYLADLLGLPPSHAREISLANGGIAVVIAEDRSARVLTLNATEPLCGPSPERPTAMDDFPDPSYPRSFLPRPGCAPAMPLFTPCPYDPS